MNIQWSSMPPRHDSILDNGYWEGAKPDLQVSIPQRASKWCIDLVRPSIMTKPNGPRNQIRRTAWLDGLRGFASLLVYIQHHELWAHDDAGHIFDTSFGYEKQYYLISFPGIRTFFTGGHFAVTVFFVLSGYVLSAKPLTLIHAGEHTKLGDNLASALFRRWPRLYFPIIVTTFLYMTSWHALGIWTESDRMSTYPDEAWNWYVQLKNFSFVFRTGGDPWITYNFHAWSIPVEFRGSIVVYTSLLAFSRCTTNARLWCQVGLMFYFMYIVDGSYCSMFVAGMLLCDLDLLAISNKLPRFFYRLEAFKELIYFNLFIVAIYLGGVPTLTNEVNDLRKYNGWYYLSFLKPQAVYDYKWFYLFWASTLLVASIQRLPWLKNFFETRFNLYLGRVSFAFYLVHGPILWTLGDRIYAAAGWTRSAHETGIPGWVNRFPISKVGPTGLELRFLLPHLILLPVTLWVAEIVTKLVDDPSVKFAKWMYGNTLAPSGPSTKL